jgi:flagellar basal-body rod modification protein FlgD
MNALVSVRSNAAGLMSPSPEERQQVQMKLLETAAARAGQSQEVAAVMSAMESQASTIQDATQEQLGKDAFLQLLVLEMQNQDPLNPLDNTDMIAQLAQFSALEAQTNLNESFEALSGNVDQLNFISAAQLLGKTVTGVDLNGALRTGVVESVHLDGSVVVVTVDGEPMSMAGIVGIVDGETGGDNGESTGDEGTDTPRSQ